MDGSSEPMLWYRRFNPQGKVRQRVQDLRIPSSSCRDFIATRPRLDLSHNESARLAADSLLSRGLEGYHEVLNAEGEVDFLSELDKIYILENGMDGSTGDPGAADDQLESSSVDSQSVTGSPSISTNSDPTAAAVGLSSLKGVESPDLSSIEIHFQSESTAASLKDLVREFIKKATTALAIVMDSFSDVELLCDLLEASGKRNVSVHLLLDHLNLNLFVSMWQDLKLNGKDFPKLSVCSVRGLTYCAKTGKKLAGQTVENFIISDWTEVLTGSYSFCWLSWQVHRSLAVLVKGSAVRHFHQEFHRLNSSSRAVPGFVTDAAASHTLPLHIYTALDASQTNYAAVSKVKSAQTKWAWNEDSHKTQTKAKIPLHEKFPQLYPKPGVEPEALRSESVRKPKHAVGAVCPQHVSKTNVNPLEENPNQIQSQLHSLSKTHISYVQSELASLTITMTAERNVRDQEANPRHTAVPTHRKHRAVCQTPFSANLNLKHCHVDAEGLFFQQRKRDGLIKTLGAAADQNTHRQQWYCSLNFKPKGNFLPDFPKVLSPTSSQHKEVKTGLFSSLTQPRGQLCGQLTRASPPGSRWQDHQRLHQHHPLLSYPSTNVLGSRSPLTAVGTHLPSQPQPDSEVLSPGTPTKLQPLKWIHQGYTARPRPAACYDSLGTTYRTGRQAAGGRLTKYP